MNHYLSIKNIDNLSSWIEEARGLKANPSAHKNLGEGKTICLLFFNNSLRTRLSTQKAAMNLGMEVMVMNFGNEGWQLEFEDGVVMDKGKSEHIKEAAKVVSQYCDIVAIRAFASLTNKAKDEAELVLNGFVEHASIPVVNMESSNGHPLQALTDAITLDEHKTKTKPKVVLSWAPHPKALPHAVVNSFVEMMELQDADFVITHPKEYELNPEITKDVQIEYDQKKALENADFVYVKNWSSYAKYGKVLHQDSDWMMTAKKLGKAKFMHCLPVRRNVVVADEVLDGSQSLVIEQANNRTYAAQVVLKRYWKIDKMSLKLKDKICIVTGATSGMGKAIAERFHEEGAKLVLSGRNEERGNILANKLDNSIFFAGDVSDLKYNEQLVKLAIEKFGKLDIVSMNAGILGLGSVTELSPVDWHKTLDTNLSSIFFLSKYAIPQLKKQSGTILINASIAAYKSFPNHPAYCASKAGAVSLMKQMALEYAPKIRINAICPGPIDTPLIWDSAKAFENPEAAVENVGKATLMKRLGQPEDVASLALFLVSDEASWITGTAMTIDGGILNT